MNPGFEALQPYPFQRLAQLFDGVQPGRQPRITLTVGEPGHPAPSLVLEALAQALDRAGSYPSTAGSDDLRLAIAKWLARRFDLAPLDPSRQVLPVNGTREALFAIAQVLVTPGTDGAVVCPNPFYQIYEGAALLAGSTPTFVPVLAETGFQPDFSQLSDRDWAKVELLYRSLALPSPLQGVGYTFCRLNAGVFLCHQCDTHPACARVHASNRASQILPRQHCNIAARQ